MVGEIKRPLVGAECDAVWFFAFVCDLDDRAVEVDSIDRSMFEFARFGAQVAWVGEVDAALDVEAQIIGRVETLAADTSRNFDPSRRARVVADNRSTADVGAFAGQQRPVGVKR